MRILYVAKHGSGGNQDEDAITNALTQLGHQVVCVQEGRTPRADLKYDLVLFHKWDDVLTMRRIRAPKVFWYFDLVDFPDDTLAKRNQNRMDWMKRVTPHVAIGFCTDGDWVNRDTTGKLVRLLQGADGRLAFPGTPGTLLIPILFTGIKNGGAKRYSFVDHMERTWNRGGKQSFYHAQRVHGKPLADLIASSKVVVAPDGPVTDHYWSNRVYLTLGFKAVLFHPYCATLEDHYKDREEIVYYHSREELRELLLTYFQSPEDRKRIAHNGYQRTITEHLYLHRCKTLIQTVKERLGIDD